MVVQRVNPKKVAGRIILHHVRKVSRARAEWADRHVDVSQAVGRDAMTPLGAGRSKLASPKETALPIVFRNERVVFAIVGAV
jgi:hypothetical protein